MKPIRYSPFHSLSAALHPEWVNMDGMLVPNRIGTDDDTRLANLGLVDLSFLARTGLKGPGSVVWLESQGVVIPAINTWAPLTTGGLVARLGSTEFLLENTWGSPVDKPLHQALQQQCPLGVYPVLRQDASLVLTGTQLHTLLNQTCNLHFRAMDLAQRPVALTSMAGVSVLIAPMQVDARPCYRLWFDATYGPYLLKTLTEIATELGGGIAGLACLQKTYPSLPPLDRNAL